MDVAHERAYMTGRNREAFEQAVGRASWWRRFLARCRAATMCPECRDAFDESPPHPTGAFSDGGAWCHVPVPPHKKGFYPGASICKASWKVWEPLRKLVESKIPTPSFELVEDGRAIKCLVCNMTSHNENDVTNRFCGRCNRFHEGP